MAGNGFVYRIDSLSSSSASPPSCSPTPPSWPTR